MAGLCRRWRVVVAIIEYLFDSCCMGAAAAEVTIARTPVGPPAVQAPVARVSSLGRDGLGRDGLGRDGLAGLLADGKVRSGREVGPDNGALPDTDLLPVLPALRDLLPHGALARGSVVSA